MDFAAFLKRLQSADDRTKRRWVVLTSAVLIALVFFVWLKYFNAFTDPGIRGAAEPAEERGFSFSGAVKAAAVNLYNWFFGAVETVGSVLRTPRDYLIRPPQ